MSQEPKAAVQSFFTAFGAGDMDALIATIHDDIKIAIQGPGSVPWYGQYSGKDGFSSMLVNLTQDTETQAFSVDNVVADDNVVFAYGHLKHRIVPTDKIFECDWTLRCKVEDGKIISYQFFEDTAAADLAFQAS